MTHPIPEAALADRLLALSKVGFGYDINDADRRMLRNAAYHFLSLSSTPHEAVTKSAPPLQGSLPSGESEPVVTLACGGADTTHEPGGAVRELAEQLENAAAADMAMSAQSSNLADVANSVAADLRARAASPSTPPQDAVREALDRARDDLAAIQQATINGKVCDDVAWFDEITTLHDFCAQSIDNINAALSGVQEKRG